MNTGAELDCLSQLNHTPNWKKLVDAGIGTNKNTSQPLHLSLPGFLYLMLGILIEFIV